VDADTSVAPPDGYHTNILSTLDGVLIYVTLRGEHVGTYFGTTERAAAAAAATALIDRATGPTTEETA
jgi:hypothetical protein